MILMVMNQSCRLQCQVMFSLRQIQMVTYDNIYRYMHIQGLEYTNFFVYHLMVPRNNDTPVAMSTSRNQLLVSKRITQYQCDG